VLVSCEGGLKPRARFFGNGIGRPYDHTVEGGDAMSEPTTVWTGRKAHGAAKHFNSDRRRRADAPLLQRVVEPLRGGETVLDIGAGTGFLSLEVAKKLTAGGSVIALDASADMLAQLAELSKTQGTNGTVRTLLADASDTGLADASVDVVVSSMVFHELSDPGEVAREIARVLKPGGSVVVADFRRTLLTRLFTLFHHGGSHGVFTPAQMVELLEGAGLRDVAVEARGMRMTASAEK
jgi:SAM-dependent methyltransferase